SHKCKINRDNIAIATPIASSLGDLTILERNSSTTRVLLFLAIPGHLTFVFVISRLATNDT
ncbi:unnamed protein product, partial [Adineta steineri]